MTGHRQRSSRLLRWLVVGPAAVAGLVAVVAGGPVLLLWFGGNPLPHQRPTAGEVVALLTSPDDGQLLVWVLTVVGWGAWAVVAGSLLLELGAQLTGRHTPQVPGLAGPQRLAGVLVAGVLAALTAPGISHAHAAYVQEAAVVAAPEPPAPPLLVTPPGQVPPALGQVPPAFGQVPQVAGPAAGPGPALPGAPEEAPEGAPGAEPVTAAGDTEAAELVHEVAEGDWMWHIAGRYLGDELRYPEIAARNPEYAQRYPGFPDHIQPGDQLVLPDDAYDRGERRHATGELLGEPPSGPAQPESPEPESADSDSGDPDSADPDSGDPDFADPDAGDPGSTDPASPEPPGPDGSPGMEPSAGIAPSPSSTEPPDSSPPQQAAPLPVPPPHIEVPADPPADPTADPTATPTGAPTAAPAGDREPAGAAAPVAAPLLGPLVTSGVLASVLLGALVLYRWRKLAHRRHRRLVSAAGDAPAEASLRAAATADVGRLDQALRVLAARSDDASGHAGQAPSAGAAKPVRSLPDVGAVWIGDGEIHLILAAPSQLTPPEPFGVGGPGNWFLPVQAELPDAGGVVAPLPALVTIGSQPGAHLLVDLERMGMLTICGPPERCRDLLRYLVAELVHNPWSDRVEVTLAGFAPESAQALAGLRPDRITVADSVPEAVHQLRRRLAHTTEALDRHGLADSVHGRVADLATDTWTPHLLLIEAPGPEHDELLSYLEETLAQGRRCAVAAVVAGPAGAPYGRRPITITGEGLLKAGFLHDAHAMPAAALPEHLLEPLGDLLRDAAGGTDHPIPPAPEHWAAGADATGGYPAPGPEPPEREVSAAVTVLPEPPATPDDEPHPGEPHVRAPDAGDPDAGDSAAGDSAAGDPDAGDSDAGDPAAGELAAGDSAAGDPDTELEEALAAWQQAADQPPRIGLLGPVQVTAPGPLPSQRLRACQELIVYLAASGEQGADAVEIASQLWPSQQVRPTIRTEVIMSVRQWLGTGPDGSPCLSEAVPDGRYRLSSSAMVDWHLFRRLRARGERRGRAGAADLRAALALVRGAPLADASELAAASVRVPYSWLPGSSIAPELIQAGIIDTAHQLVELSLADGDLATARWAVQQAWLADPRHADDLPWRDLLRIHLAAGEQAQLPAVVADLLRWRDAEHPDELAPATRDLIRSLPIFQSTTETEEGQ